ncbi:MAG: endonuclease/exonuclease/phosphatase family protein [Alphaproteobacteria bacterium]
MKLRIATFNLENLGPKPGHPNEHRASLEERCAVLRPQLERLEADILCLQEINGQALSKGAPFALPALDALLEGTAYAGYARAASEHEERGGALDVHNLVILSRHPIAGVRQLWHHLVPPPAYRSVTADPPAPGAGPVRWERPLLCADVALPGGRVLHVVNLHLRAPLAAFIPGQKAGPFAWKSVAGWAEGFFLAAVKRAGQALEARMLVDELFDRDDDALIAVCGDCNAEARETATRLIAGDEEDTGNGALAARALVMLERGIAEDLRYTVIHNGRKVMLDHLLVSKALMGWYRKAEIHNEALGDELVAYANLSASPESYHAPLVASFEAPG